MLNKKGKPKKRCLTDGCIEFAYARGYCRRCYNIWHRRNFQRSKEELSLNALRREAVRYKELYDNAYGLENRVVRRREYEKALEQIGELEEQLRKNDIDSKQLPNIIEI